MTPRLAALVVAVLLAPFAAAQESGSWIVKARLVVPVEGAPIEKGAVRITGQKIEAIGATTDTKGVPEQHIVEFPDGIVYPGLVDAGSYQGIRRERDDLVGPYLPDNRMADAFDPNHPGFLKNFAAGITTIHLMQGNASVVGGRTAVVKVGPEGAFRVLSRDAGLKVSLVEDAYPDNRAPTSIIGALAGLKDPPEDLRLALEPFKKGEKTAFVSTSNNRETVVALSLKKYVGFRPVLVADMTCGRFADEIKDVATGVILDSLAASRQPFEWRYLADLLGSGVPVAFASGSPLQSPGVLKLNAAIAARHGVSVDRVLRALTIDAATILGVGASVGSLKAGKDADLVVLSGPIEDPRSRVLLCVQDGKVVYRAPKESS